MTSNLGSQVIQELAGEDYDIMKMAVMEIVGQQFRPEFINRVDDVVVFHPLGQAQIRAIADIQINYLRLRLQQQNMQLTVTGAALDHLGEAGFDPVYGARPLRRSIQHELENPLAQAILSGQFGPGAVIVADWVDGQMQFKGG
jgi:ATP-dependent Clp protease ATP-binding subunit ClpB